MTTIMIDRQAEMIEKISKLLAQANSAAKVGNHTEADAFTEKAFALMAKYDIDAAMIKNATGEVKDELTVEDFLIEGEFGIDKTELFFAITRGVGARALRYRKRVPGTRQTYINTMRVWGYESQIKRIKLLYEFLVPQMISGSASAASIVTWESKRSYRKTWMDGFGSAICGRLQRAQQQAVVEADQEEAGSGTGAALVLADKNARAKSFFDDANTKTLKNGRKVNKFTTQRRTLSGTGHGAGYEAGKRASLGDNTIGGSRLALSR